MIEYIKKAHDSGGVLAILITADEPAGLHPERELRKGIRFVTDESSDQQVAIIEHQAGHRIEPHVHLPVQRIIRSTPETIIVLSGVVEAEIYTMATELVCRRTLREGDVLVLLGGGHGFTVVEPCRLIEVKQGPFDQSMDKVRFTPKGKA
jgi:hypothetical protein